MILLLWGGVTDDILVAIDSTLPFPISVLVIRNSPLQWPVGSGDNWPVSDDEEWLVPAEPVMAWSASTASSWGVTEGSEWELRR